MNKHSHVRSFLSVVTRPRAEPAVNDFPVVAWKAAEGKLRLLSLMCIYCRCLKLVASQYAICRTILPCVQLGNGLEPVRDSIHTAKIYKNNWCIYGSACIACISHINSTIILSLLSPAGRRQVKHPTFCEQNERRKAVVVWGWGRKWKV